MTLALLAAFLAHPIGILAVLGLLAVGMATVGPVVPLGALTPQGVAGLGSAPVTPIAASGAINPHQSANYIITKAGIAALTLGAPTAGADDGVVITVTSNTAYAHTLTATGLFLDGSGNVNVLTFAAHAGAACYLTAYQGKWLAREQNTTMS
jgi:hypothetical protein